MNRALIQRIKRTLFVLGIAFLIGTVIISIAVVGGVIQFPENLIAGESTVHSIDSPMTHLSEKAQIVQKRILKLSLSHNLF